MAYNSIVIFSFRFVHNEATGQIYSDPMGPGQLKTPAGEVKQRVYDIMRSFLFAAAAAHR